MTASRRPAHRAHRRRERPLHRARQRRERPEPRGLRRPVWALSASVLLVGLLFVVGFPVHTYVQQRDAVAAAQSQVRRVARQNATLAAEVRRLDTDSEIERLARQVYGLVAPGEDAYAVLPLAPGEKPLAGPARTATGLPGAAAVPSAGGQRSSRPAPGFWRRMIDELSF